MRKLEADPRSRWEVICLLWLDRLHVLIYIHNLAGKPTKCIMAPLRIVRKCCFTLISVDAAVSV